MNSRFTLLLALLSVGLAILFDLLPVLKSFDYNVGSLLSAIWHHPSDWISLRKLVTYCIVWLILWGMHREDSPFSLPQQAMFFGIAFIIGLPITILVALYVYQRRREQSAA